MAEKLFGERFELGFPERMVLEVAEPRWHAHALFGVAAHVNSGSLHRPGILEIQPTRDQEKAHGPDIHAIPIDLFADGSHFQRSGVHTAGEIVIGERLAVRFVPSEQPDQDGRKFRGFVPKRHE